MKWHSIHNSLSVYCSCFCTLYPSMTVPLHHYMMARTFSCPSPFGCLTSIGSNHGQCCAVYLSAQSPSTIFPACLPQHFPYNFISTVRCSMPHPTQRYLSHPILIRIKHHGATSIYDEVLKFCWIEFVFSSVCLVSQSFYLGYFLVRNFVKT